MTSVTKRAPDVVKQASNVTGKAASKAVNWAKGTIRGRDVNPVVERSEIKNSQKRVQTVISLPKEPKREDNRIDLKLTTDAKYAETAGDNPISFTPRTLLLTVPVNRDKFIKPNTPQNDNKKNTGATPSSERIGHCYNIAQNSGLKNLAAPISCENDHTKQSSGVPIHRGHLVTPFNYGLGGNSIDPTLPVCAGLVGVMKQR